MMSFPYFFHLNNVSFSTLLNQDYRVVVTDPDEANLSASQLQQLHDQGKAVNAYLSIGEAEDYREYWQQWGGNIPDYVLGENPDWAGNFSVAFWDKDWQDIIITRAVEMAKEGFDGLYLDIVDAYLVPEVVAAYGGNESQLRAEMENFVIRLSQAVKAINPDMNVIPQNAVELLAIEGSSTIANMPYLNAIDGVGVEDLFYVNNQVSEWTQWDLEYVQTAMEQGKFALATGYPTIAALQADYIAKATAAGLIPFVTDRDLEGTVPVANVSAEAQLPEGWDATFSGVVEEKEQVDTVEIPEKVDMPVHQFVFTDIAPQSVTVGDANDEFLMGRDVADSILGGDGVDYIYGNDGADYINGGAGHDVLSGDGGNDRILGGSGADSILGGSGYDVMKGDGDADTLRAGEGDDSIRGGKGHDSLYGDVGDDVLYGDKHNDVLHGGKGDDTLYGGKG